MTNIYDREEWLNLVRENNLWISDICPNKAYDKNQANYYNSHQHQFE